VKLPEWFSWRQNLLYSFAALGGALGAHRLILNQSEPTIGIVIGAVLGANIGAVIQTRKGKNLRFDELNRKILDNSMVHGFITYTVLIGYQAFTKPVFSPTEELIAAAVVVITSLVLQALRFLEKTGDILS
jgi:membrane-bound acyltransferase YfiQ involved in biofilm formation